VDLTAALAWLDEHIDLEKTVAIAGRPPRLSLGRMEALCSVLGDPQRDQPTLHVTGTNGKGSVARILASILGAHDLTVGTYTSPHLEHIGERIARNGEPIDDASLAAVLTDLAAIEGLLAERPSYFELLTAAAFRWFSDVAVSAAVVEVGLLGRWDATNVVDATVAVLTHVGRDHTDGSEGWRQRVAEEKAGIVKPGSTFVLGEADPELRPTFAATPAAETWVRGEDFACEANVLAVGGRSITVRTPHGTHRDLFLPLHGPHQGENAAVAVAAAEAFFGRALDEEVLAGALAQVTVPGRLEVVRHAPLVVLDGAHNPDGARALARALREGFAPAGGRHLVLGVLAGRDPAELLAALGVGPDDQVVCATPPSPRGVPAGDLAQAVTATGARATVVPEVGEALRRALDRAGDEDLVVVTGSLYTVGEARSACRALGLL
jgi:dihydrofolate synthase / folylpolyglutamate synthase